MQKYASTCYTGKHSPEIWCGTAPPQIFSSRHLDSVRESSIHFVSHRLSSRLVWNSEASIVECVCERDCVWERLAVLPHTMLSLAMLPIIEWQTQHSNRLLLCCLLLCCLLLRCRYSAKLSIATDSCYVSMATVLQGIPKVTESIARVTYTEHSTSNCLSLYRSIYISIDMQC